MKTEIINSPITVKPIKEEDGLDIKPITPKAKKVKVRVDKLNVRKDPSMNAEILVVIEKDQVYTIDKEEREWGYIASLSGWIKLEFVDVI